MRTRQAQAPVTTIGIAAVTHVALGQVRVQRNTGTMGEAVGLAVAVCKKKSCTPRAVYPKYWADLTALFLGE